MMAATVHLLDVNEPIALLVYSNGTAAAEVEQSSVTANLAPCLVFGHSLLLDLLVDGRASSSPRRQLSAKD